jgi:hypothetical protein
LAKCKVVAKDCVAKLGVIFGCSIVDKFGNCVAKLGVRFGCSLVDKFGNYGYTLICIITIGNMTAHTAHLKYIKYIALYNFICIVYHGLTYLIDIKAMPTNTAFTASLRPAYSIANGSISYNVRNAITPPTVSKGK